jgi:LSD1 subclass zinc finger protein
MTIAAALERPDCPVCGPAPYRIWLDEGRGTRFVRCSACRTVFASPRLALEHRRAALDRDFAPGASAAANAESRAPALAREAALVQRLVGRGRLLDVGCDLGDFFAWFPSPAWSRYGVEVSASAARQAAARHDADVRVGDLRDTRFPGGYFDVVTMLDVIHHVDDLREALLEVRRVLRPRGVLAIEVPGQAYMLWRNRGLVCRIVDGRWSRIQSDSHYVQWLHPSALLRLLADTGFAAVARHVVQSPHTSSRARNVFATTHAGVMRAVTAVSARAWSLAPKYLLVARAGAGAAA